MGHENPAQLLGADRLDTPHPIRTRCSGKGGSGLACTIESTRSRQGVDSHRGHEQTFLGSVVVGAALMDHCAYPDMTLALALSMLNYLISNGVL
jgi:hypothetical protein